MMTTLTFEKLSEVNIARCKRWHGENGLDDWPPEKWLLATIGELGEIANALKKLWRIRSGMANISESDRQLSSENEAVAAIAGEIADTIIYYNLYCERLGDHLKGRIFTHDRFSRLTTPEGFLLAAFRSLAGASMNYRFVESLCGFALLLSIDVEAAVIEKFNATSIKYGFPERL